MSNQSKIEWTDATWNVTSGCTKCSPGCNNCYALRDSWRMANNPNPKIQTPFLGTVEKVYGNGELRWTGKINLNYDKLKQPIMWVKSRNIFVNSLSDLFHPDVPFDYIDKVIGVMAVSQPHTFQVVTKRLDRALTYMNGVNAERIAEAMRDVTPWGDPDKKYQWMVNRINTAWPLPNVWFLATCCNQEEAERNIGTLLQIPAAIRGVSIEPMLGSIDLVELNILKEDAPLLRYNALKGEAHFSFGDGGDAVFDKNCDDKPLARGKLDWVICGGETGKNARPMNPKWGRDLRDQCKGANIPFFFKSWGEFVPHTINQIAHKEHAGQMVPYTTVSSTDRKWLGKTRYWCIPFDANDDYRDIDVMERVGKKAAGHLIDSEEWRQFPEASK
jgi:protein gp37